MIQNQIKPIHAKPSFYAINFEPMKEIALKYGYNLVLHGSLNRDLDLIAIPWEKKVKSHRKMVKEFAEFIGGSIHHGGRSPIYSKKPHRRIVYVVDIYRGGYKSGAGFAQLTYCCR